MVKDIPIRKFSINAMVFNEIGYIMGKGFQCAIDLRKGIYEHP